MKLKEIMIHVFDLRESRESRERDPRVQIIKKKVLQIIRGAALGQGRNHHHRHRPQSHQIAKELQAIHLGHFDIQCQDIGIEALDFFPGDIGVRSHADHFNIRI